MKIPEAMARTPQWVLWKLEQRNGKGCKVPYQVNGDKASSTDPTHWSTFEEVLQVCERGGWAGIGFVFSVSDDFVGIDLDNCFTDDGEAEPWAQDVLSWFPSYTELSPSGKGLKIFLQGQPNLARGRRLNIPGKAGAHLEIYSSGRYFTVTGDQWGRCEQVTYCQAGLDWLTQVVLPEPAAPPAPPPPSPRPQADRPGRPDAVARAEMYASNYPPAISGQGGHDTTYRLACVLVNGFSLGIDGARPILQSWNMGCQPPWSPRELEHKLKQAERAGSREGQAGYMLAEESLRLELSAEPLSRSELDGYDVYLGNLLGKAQASKSKGGFPEHLLRVPGFIGEVAEWITSQNPRKNRILSLVAAVALQGCLIGSKYRDRSGNRSNLYMVALAPSGGGKQAPQSCIKKILNQINCGSMYGGKVSSDSALASDLIVSRSKLYLWDEFGRFLAKTAAKVGGAHLHAVQEALLELWGEAGGTWKQKSYADQKQNKEVMYPCCSFLGMTVPEHFWGGLEEGHLQDGFAARMMVIDSGPKSRSEDITETDPPTSILQRAAWWANLRPGGSLGAMNPDAILVPETPAATEIFKGLVRRAEDAGQNESEAAIWARAIEKARRLGLIYACSRDPEAPCIDDQAARWGVELATYTTERFISVMADEVTSDDPAQQKWQKVRKIIQAYTNRTQLCSRSQLLRACKWNSKDLDKILDTMAQAGVIEVKTTPAANGKSTTYYSVKG